MTIKPFSITQAFSTAWRKAIENIGTFSLILLVAWLISFLTERFSRGEGGVEYLLSLVVSFLGSVALLLIQMGALRVALKVLDGGKGTLNDFSFTFRQFLKFAVANVISGIIVVVGLLFLVVPGIFLAIRLQFFSYFLIEDNLDPISALRQSWAVTKNHVWDLFIFDLLLVFLIALGALLFGAGLIVAMPVAFMASTFVYRSMKKASHDAKEELPAGAG